MEWEHKSKVDGVMHACRHDTHVAILFCAATLLDQSKHGLLLPYSDLFYLCVAKGFSLKPRYHVLTNLPDWLVHIYVWTYESKIHYSSKSTYDHNPFVKGMTTIPFEVLCDHGFFFHLITLVSLVYISH